MRTFTSDLRTTWPLSGHITAGHILAHYSNLEPVTRSSLPALEQIVARQSSLRLDAGGKVWNVIDLVTECEDGPVATTYDDLVDLCAESAGETRLFFDMLQCRYRTAAELLPAVEQEILEDFHEVTGGVFRGGCSGEESPLTPFAGATSVEFWEGAGLITWRNAEGVALSSQRLPNSGDPTSQGAEREGVTIAQAIALLEEVPEEKRGLPLYVCDMTTCDNFPVTSVDLFDVVADHDEYNMLAMNFEPAP